MSDSIQERLKEIVDIQCHDGNWNANRYMHGMANGLILALSIVEGNENPAFLDAPAKWLSPDDEIPQCPDLETLRAKVDDERVVVAQLAGGLLALCIYASKGDIYASCEYGTYGEKIVCCVSMGANPLLIEEEVRIDSETAAEELLELINRVTLAVGEVSNG